MKDRIIITGAKQHFPVKMGRFLAKMAKRAQRQQDSDSRQTGNEQMRL